MIKYNTLNNKYLYRMEDLDKIIKLIEDGSYYNDDFCTQENVSLIVNAVNDFMTNMNIIRENVALERHETEDEAREYFGDEFISRFDHLLTSLDREDTMVAIHGTDVTVCPLICDEGLCYKFPSLSSTAVQQKMAYGQRDMHYDDYEGLLNWKHKDYKGLVILAIPYECYYKEGLWNHFQETNSSFYGGQDYKIDPDFVVGYIDVLNKKIVLNPKYSRVHNYDGYVRDTELFREQKGLDNDSLKKLIIEAESKLEPLHNKIDEEVEEDKVDISRVPYIIEELIGTFNSIKLGFPDGMTEERYDRFLEELSYGFNDIIKAIPFLKTNEQVRKEEEERFSVFNNASSDQSYDDDLFTDFDWGEDISFDDENPSMKF